MIDLITINSVPHYHFSKDQISYEFGVAASSIFESLEESSGQITQCALSIMLIQCIFSIMESVDSFLS